MAKLKTSRGWAIVDKEDLPLLEQYRWSFAGNGYVANKSAGPTIYLHRLVVRAPKGTYVDHINHDKLDNRKANLRFCTQTQNRANSVLNKRGTISGFKGVALFKNLPVGTKRWRACIKVNHKVKSPGYYHSAKEAALAYNNAALETFGEFALLNKARNG